MTHISSERIASIEAKKHELAGGDGARPTSRPTSSCACPRNMRRSSRSPRRRARCGGCAPSFDVLNGLVADPTAEPELKEMAATEAEDIRHRLPEAERALAVKLLPRDAADDRAAMLEVRAGTGGDEAALFAGDLLRMYQRYADEQGWRFELISASARRSSAATRKRSPRSTAPACSPGSSSKAESTASSACR